LKILDSGFRRNDGKGYFQTFYEIINNDEFVKSRLGRHPGESRGPELLELTGFRLSPE